MHLKWDGAKEFCRAGNMTLLNVETEEEDYTIFINGKYNPGKKILTEIMLRHVASFYHTYVTQDCTTLNIGLREDTPRKGIMNGSGLQPSLLYRWITRTGMPKNLEAANLEAAPVFISITVTFTNGAGVIIRAVITLEQSANQFQFFKS